MEAVDRRALLARLATAVTGLLDRQGPAGEWCFELEADATIPAEYVLLTHYLGSPEPDVQRGIAVYLRRMQRGDGSWPLFHGGDGDISASIKAYYALKLAGEDPALDHMARARRFVLEAGGLARANVFTRMTLALFGQLPWGSVPAMPVEIMLLPRWSPFHLDKVSYWSRVVIVPLLVLMALKPRAANPRKVDIAELLLPAPATQPSDRAPDGWARLFQALDRAVRAAEPIFPEGTRRRALGAAFAFIEQRRNGSDGLGAIFPAMANAVMAMSARGVPADDPKRVQAMAELRGLLVHDGDEVRCQPCLSPVWDTALSVCALQEVGGAEASIERARDWLLDRQVTATVGDWGRDRPGLAPGGWAFQYRNDHYPDLDDTAAVILALGGGGGGGGGPASTRAADWIAGMQSRNGGWGAFDADNVYLRLNRIPFADHGALVDPPTADVSARCLAALGSLGRPRDLAVIDRGLAFLRREQEADGSWFGRWGANYVYGSWSALWALGRLRVPTDDPAVVRAVRYLVETQRPDGGWGEDASTYHPQCRGFARSSTASQTAWALLGLMAAGAVDHRAVARGVNWLLRAPSDGPFWDEPWFTGVGFPRVFHLRYRGYPAYFPIWALARWLKLIAAR